MSSQTHWLIISTVGGLLFSLVLRITFGDEIDAFLDRIVNKVRSWFGLGKIR